MLLVVVEDRQADAALQQVLSDTRAHGASIVVLTTDVLLMLRLRRQGVDARLPLDTFTATATEKIDAGDRLAFTGVAAALGSFATFDGTNYAPYLEYTLAPSFVRAVRNLTALQELLETLRPGRVVTVGGGALVQAARVVATTRRIPLDRLSGDLVTRAWHAIARLRAGRATRWVNTEFRALVLEPGFLTLLFLKGLWRRLTSPARPPIRADALIVVGDRFTADVIERLQGTRQIILAGATRPGRALFDGTRSLVPIEWFAGWGDILHAVAALLDALTRALALAADREHGGAFVVGDVSYWPLVRRTACLHVLIWTQRLRYLRAVASRAAAAAPQGGLLTSVDVTAYARTLIDTVRRHGIASIGIQHGITAEANGHAIVHVDTLATWGEQAEEWYRIEAAKRGRGQTAHFVVTGNPRYDSLAPLIAASPSRASSRDATACFTVCVCTGFLTDFSVSASEYENVLMIETVLEWAGRHNGARVIHKLHPGEEPEYYADAARVLGWDPLKMTVVGEPILHEILQQSHVLVSGYSSTVLESIALGTPAIVFDALVRRGMVRTPRHPLDGVPGVSVAYSTATVGDRLDAIRNGAPIDREQLRTSAELRAFLSDLDGHAADRVAALVERKKGSDLDFSVSNGKIKI